MRKPVDYYHDDSVFRLSTSTHARQVVSTPMLTTLHSCKVVSLQHGGVTVLQTE